MVGSSWQDAPTTRYMLAHSAGVTSPVPCLKRAPKADIGLKPSASRSPPLRLCSVSPGHGETSP